LEQEGMNIHYEENEMLLDKEASLVVYTPAINAQHVELKYYLSQQYEVVKRSELLGSITNSSFNICVAGTHGKTTTSSMVAHLLQHSGMGCNAFLGGIATNYGKNFWSSDNDICVVEADEFDRSFLKLNPDVAIITSMDADHLDIYGSEANVKQAFIDFSQKVKPDGLLISKFGLQRANDFINAHRLTYDRSNVNADVYADGIEVVDGCYFFDVVFNKESYRLNGVKLAMGGLHNVENMVAAIAVAHHLKVADDKIIAAVASYRGVKRRFEYIIAPGENKNGVIQIDDYAHHPEELRNLIESARSLFKGKKMTVIFQPHLFSRTRDFLNGFAEVLDLSDEVILLPIYPARELPIEGISSDLIMTKMKNKKTTVVEKADLINWMKGKEFELFITAGAGDIDALVSIVKQEIISR
jgi:UDP-N-acetylmuramate--alanine ligase